ncbi:putative cyclohexanone monooxygenase [Venustampulla echinocandica]|uniref:Putative cyclohexanone monooxygenase n=1 Tax=Venustampulla echinocandica TaxID=2656787 RepID=A0A370TY98_9HELO|nr:putative cyclohexanone monooxygenase [Venustampulla echinocandica]RDL40492.1 putative cyclohexanone monooxygenase [Venustampulla echinocandica]
MGSVTPDKLPNQPFPVKSLDTEPILAKYREERAKRIRKDGPSQFIQPEGSLSYFKEDVGAPPLTRDPINVETKVLIVGAGFGGLGAGVKLKNQGVEDFLIVEKGAGYGGTWYWNQYPGVSCDVEALIYLPFLEETGYIPKSRFPQGPEIREHMSRIVEKWDIAPKTHLQTEITSIVWDEFILRWHIHTNHADHFVSQFVVLATGTLHQPHLPGIPGIEDFKRDHFHSSRFDYGITGGDPAGNMTKLAGKTVGIIGTGASAAQLVPKLAQDAKKLYVFQRTPSSITPRHNQPPDPSIIASLKPGWQKARMSDFANILQGENLDVESTALEGLDVLTMRTILKEARKAGIEPKPENIPELYRQADFTLMESLRKLIEDTVTDKETADKLKPWYAFMCKRPVFHNDYLPAFNKPNVELIDTDGKGVSHLTDSGVVANNKEYEVDLLIFSTGFEFETASTFYRRTGIHLVGSKGQTFDEKWAGGPSTLFGIHVRDFPNLFLIGPVQAGVTANSTHTVYVAADHIAEVVAGCLKEEMDFQAIEPTEEAEEDWGKQIEEGREARLEFAKGCPPGYYNKEGKPEDIPARWGMYPKGIEVYTKLIREWREEGSMKGLERR